MNTIPGCKHILFITSSRIGDAVLSTGILDHISQNFPGANVTIACGPLAVSLFEGYPLLDQIIPLKKEKYSRHWLRLWRRVILRRWDIVIDLRNSAVSRLIFTRRRHIFGPQIDKSQHKVEQAAQLLGLSTVPAPKLWFSDVQSERARALIPAGGAVLGVGPTTNWAGKTWPAERFIEVLSWMTGAGGVMEGARVVVFAAPGEEADARKVLMSLPDGRGLDLIAKTDPGTAAAALSLCAFYIGNDSGLMHCAAAAGVRTLGLFGPSYPYLYRPWGAHCGFVSTPETFDELISFDGYDSKICGTLMGTLSVDAVQKAITKLFESPQK
ncbi:MAG: glycosyltransferase family 9 protein [Alphaproteobacteria bacterium]|nr:glycosyltransferase family 9 protein [Alphaproteobacteria bacterium]MBP7758845.1 glycosyltransferase family 9 protein [Alphaproteobacteria bacterium]MBP7762081.1 glycosyltransferase family 9 protein [Alphaproteobacteria bacterium]MBP7904638.1 glycosyltransferase family 9 protein [Alphaproteobacteria bacterium]